jgi:outer membrane protein assembly factor BamB
MSRGSVSATLVPLLLLLAAALGACGTSSGPATTTGGGSSGGNSGGSSPPPQPKQHTDVVTYKNDSGRTGQNLTESLLTPANVNAASFGQLRLLAADGKVDAQPLYLSGLTVQGATHNVVYVATENDSVYAYDADSGAVLWHVSLLPAGESVNDLPGYGCQQLAPTIGITSTPVIDRSAGAHGAIYLVAMSVATSSATYHQRLHALDITTGAELPHSPVDINATFPTLGGVTTFDPAQYAERAALLLSQGTLYTSWTSHCDVAPYTGWIIAFSASTLARTAVLNVAPNSGGSGPSIWMSGGGPAADAAGNVYLLTANGVFETTLDAAGFPNAADYGNSFLKLTLTAGTLAVSDYFAMFNEVSESAADVDLGSGGILLLPDQTDSGGTVRHLAVGAGKDGNLYVVNRDSMGKFNAATNNIWQELPAVLGGGIWSTPAYFNGAVYYGPVNGPLSAFALHAALLSAAPTAASANSFAYPGTSPVISANGTGNAIVWAHENSDPGVLHAYEAGNLGHELYNSSQAPNGRDQFGPGNKFITPAVADGRVFVGTQSGVAVFGLLN